MIGPQLLSLDTGAALGWGLSRGSTIIASGLENLSVHGGLGRRCMGLYNFLTDLDNEIGGIDEILLEDVVVYSLNQIRFLRTSYAYRGIIHMFAAGKRINVTPMNPSTVKAQFLHGKASKEEMCERCHQLGWEGGKPGTARDHDEADALAHLIVILRQRGFEPKFLQA